MAHFADVSLILNWEKLHLLPKYPTTLPNAARDDFLFSTPAWLSSCILKMCMVPLSEAAEINIFVGSIERSVINAWSAPLLTSESYSPVSALNTLTKVPLLEAVARISPFWDSFIACRAVLWHLNSFTFLLPFPSLPDVSCTVWAQPTVVWGKANTQLSSATDTDTIPKGLGLVAKLSEQSKC